MSRKAEAIQTVEEFVDYLKQINQWKFMNYTNVEFINTLFEDAKEVRDPLLKSLGTIGIGRSVLISRGVKSFSKRSIQSYKDMGWVLEDDLERIKKEISLAQKCNSSRTIEYWLKKGCTEEEAKMNVFEVQSKNGKVGWENPDVMMQNNPRFKLYWLNRGCTDEEASELTNPMSAKYWADPGEEAASKRKAKISTRVKWLHRETDIYDDHSTHLGYISKEEIEFFKVLQQANESISNKPFKVNIKKCFDDKNLKIYDGYLKTEAGIILLEYDGTYWHDEVIDKGYDDCVLESRKDIIAIIRFNDIYAKKYKNNFLKIKEDLNYAIKEIESGKKGIYKFYQKSA